MSKKNEIKKVEEVSEKKLSFEEMKKQVEEFKRLQKIIKALPKEDREKLLPTQRKREIPESLKGMANKLFYELSLNETFIKEEFDKSVTIEKPEGNKSISLSIEDSDFTIAIIRKTKKDKKEDSE